MRVAVTGAAGFVGTNPINQLIDDGHEVVAIDRVAPPEDAPSSERLTWLEGDIFDSAAMTTALTGVDRVHHLVAMITLKQEDPVAWRVNTAGVASVARAALAAGVGRSCTAARSTCSTNTTAAGRSTKIRRARPTPPSRFTTVPSGRVSRNCARSSTRVSTRSS